MNQRRPLDPVESGLEQAVAELHQEFEGIFSRETIAEVVADSHHSLGSYRVLAFVPLLARRFARERLRASAIVHGHPDTEHPKVLFVCVHNAGRSQMAAALLDHHARGSVTARSAGSEPAEQIHPAVVEAMDELGLDLSEEFPKPLATAAVQAADVIVTLGCGDVCPVLPRKLYLDWDLQDPAGQGTDTVRRIRDDIDARVRQLFTHLLPHPDSAQPAPAKP